MKKYLSLIFAVCLMAIALPFAVFADGDVPNLEIKAYNITFKDSVFLKYAVNAENADDVQMLIWTSEQNAYEYGTQEMVLSSDGTQNVSGTICKVYTFTGLTAKQMTDSVYGRAYTVKNGTPYYSKVTKYSILDYAYSKMGKTGQATTDTKLLNLLKEMLEYGAAAQIYYNGGEGYRLDRLATDTYFQVKVVGGTLKSGFDKHLYQSGKSVTIVAPATNEEGVAFDHWENSAGAVGTAAEQTITVGTANEVYTASYEAAQQLKPKASEGLEIEDGEVSGLGTCTDEYIVLPEEKDGEAVTSIGAAAFSGEEITSVYIPRSITSIGRNAFKGCELSDVYYEGTEEEWGQIQINATGNGALNTAVKHFGSYGPTMHTVTFKDYDGTVLKSQSVADGNDAEPPENPTRTGHTFAKWEGSYKKVTSDKIVTAVYYEGTDSAFIVGDAYIASPDDEIDVPVYINIKSGITTAKVKIAFGSNVVLTGVTPGTSFSGLIGAQKYPVIGSVVLNWVNGTSDITGDYLFATLHFAFNGTPKNYVPIELTYDEDDVCNTDSENVPFSIVNGAVIGEWYSTDV